MFDDIPPLPKLLFSDDPNDFHMFSQNKLYKKIQIFDFDNTLTNRIIKKEEINEFTRTIFNENIFRPVVSENFGKYINTQTASGNNIIILSFNSKDTIVASLLNIISPDIIKKLII